MQKFSIGSDGELMVYNEKNQLCSAIGVVHGNKEEKLDLGNGHFAFYDNVLAECNLKPAYNKKEFLNNIRDCYQRYANAIHPYKLVVQASAMYPKEELEHIDAQAFGCSPSYDAYAVAQTPPVNCDVGSKFRTGGGHIHLGGETFPLNDDWGKIWVVRMMDLFLSIPSIFIDWDPTSVARRKLYGSAGDHRPTAYGVEYRSISNFWLISPEYASLIYDICDFTLDVCANEQHEKLFSTYAGKNEMADELVNCINTGNKKKAEKYMSICKKIMPKELWNNIQSLIGRTPEDFYTNWNIKIKN